MTAEIRRMAGLKYLRDEQQAHRLGMWVASLLGNERALDWCKSNIKSVKAQAESTPQAGGVLVPDELDRTIIDLRESYGQFRKNTKVVPMASEVKSIARRTGGATIYWTDEAEAVTASSETWDSISLNAKKLGAMTICSNELYEDAIINLGDEFAFEVAWGFSQREDECGFIGDGTSTYRGIVGVTNKLKNLSGTIANIAGLAVATGTGYATNYNSMTLADFDAAAALLPAYADNPNTAWYMHRQFFTGTAQRLAAAVGNSPDREPDGARRQLFLGYPVNFVQCLPKISAVSQVCALFGDLTRSSKLGDRREIKVAINPFTYATTDQTQMVAFERFDAITHEVGNATSVAADKVPGPVVGLITAAS